MKKITEKESKNIVGGVCWHRIGPNGMEAKHYKTKAEAQKGFSGKVVGVSGPGHPY